jgi:hypothetical protein
MDVRAACAFAIVLLPAATHAQDAGPDAAPDAAPDGGDSDAAPDGGGFDAAPDGGGFDAGPPEGCVTDDDCLSGTRCIDGLCGVCDEGESRACDEGCGPGTQQCHYDTRSWAQCVPDGEVECLVGERRDCDHPCGPWAGGPGYNACSPVNCTFEGECLPIEPIECLPGRSAACVTDVNLCPGNRVCMDACAFGECLPDPSLCECTGPNGACCGNGAKNPGEECDGEDACGTDCRWTEARPFRSCACRAPAERGDADALAVALLGVASAMLRRR